MLGLDHLTLLAITGLAHAVLAVLLLFFRKPSSQHDVIRWYAISHVFLAFGLVLVAGRRGGSVFWTSTIPNTLVTLGMALLSVSLAQFFRWQVTRLLIGLGLCFSLLQFFLRDLGFAEHIRLACAVVIASSGQFVVTWIYARRTQNTSRLTRFLAASNFVISLLLIWRIVEAAFADAHYDFFHAGYGQFFGLLSLFLNALINGFGFLLLLNEHGSRELFRLSTLDGLTETLNRHHIFEQAQKELALADRRDSSLFIVLIDIKNLGEINAQHHFYIGDETIKTVIATLRKHLRAGDHIGRWTGKEFLLLLPQIEASALQQWLGDFQSRCLQLSVGKQTITVNAMIAIGVTRYHRHEDFQLTLQRAESALQQAKQVAEHKIVVID